MTFSEQLVRHAIALLGNPVDSESGLRTSADLRRAVSASYYAIFHHLSEAAVAQVAPQVQPGTRNRIHRWLDHTEMKKICSEFALAHLRPPLRGLLGDAVSEDMQTVAINFIKLQEARHSADYDLEYEPSFGQAEEFLKLAVEGIGAWERVASSAEGNIFVLSLLLWKKWNTARQ